MPLSFGIALGHPLSGVSVATGALNVSFSDGRDPYRQRALRMLVWSSLGAVAVFIGSLSGANPYATIIVTSAWAFWAGMFMAVSVRAGDLGLNTLVATIVFADRGSSTLEGAFDTGLLVLGGGLLQSALALFFWPARRYFPERLAVGNAYLELARQVDPDTDLPVSSPLTHQHAEEDDVIAALGSDHSVDSERFRLLFDQAARLRLSIYWITRLRNELGEGDDQDSEAEGDAASDLDALLRAASRLLKTAGDCLIDDEQQVDFAAGLAEVQKLSENAQRRKHEEPFSLAQGLASAVDVLAGQLRVATELARRITPPEGSASTQQTTLPLKLRLSDWTARLKANLDVRSAVFRHATRLSLCIALGEYIEHLLGWQRAFWLPMTIAVVLKPDFAATFSRGVLRLMGTFAGLLLATVLYHFLPGSALIQLLLVGVFTFFLRFLGPANYGVFTVAVSGLVVFLVAISGSPPGAVVGTRVLTTVGGGLIALVVYAIWPTWERTQVSDALAEMIDATRVYLRKVVQKVTGGSPAIETELDQSRADWRRHRSEAEASVDRVLAEPGTTGAQRDSLLSVLASSHSLVNAIMGIEAGMLNEPPLTAPDALQSFVNDADFTLYYLSSALRGSRAANANLPQLREDHRRLLEARTRFSEHDQFILIETDRLTVSLNTLREQVVGYLRQ